MFPHLPAPVWQLQYLLPPVASVIPVVFHQSHSPISPLILFAQVRLGVPHFLLPGGHHFITSFGNLPSSILETCPYHCSCFVLISSKRDLVTFIFCLMILFLIQSFLEILAERRQKSISVEFNFDTVFAFLKRRFPISLCSLYTFSCTCFHSTRERKWAKFVEEQNYKAEIYVPVMNYFCKSAVTNMSTMRYCKVM